MSDDLDIRAASVGESFQPFSPEHVSNPYPFYARARAEEAIFFSPLFQAWVVTRYDDVVNVLRDPTTFSSKDTLASPFEPPPEVADAMRAGFREVVHLVNSDGDTHARLRTLAGEGFTPHRIAALEPAVRDIATALLDAMEAAGPRVDIVSAFAYPLPMTVIMRMFGVPEEDMGRCKQWTDDTNQFAFALPMFPVDRQIEIVRSVIAFQDYVAQLVAERAAEPRDDLISHMLAADDAAHRQLSTDEIAALIPGFLLAGHETTAYLIGSSIRLLLANRDHWDELVRDPTVVKAIVEEALRAEASIQLMMRTATKDVELGQRSIEAGARLVLVFGSANHDEAKYGDPGAFDPSRPGPKHLSFGRGAHFCIGAPLARLEASVALELLSARFPALRLADDSEPAYAPTMMFRGPARMDVEW